MTNILTVDNVDPVLQFTDHRLRQISTALPEADFDSAELADKLKRMNESMIVYGGIGIAAPQIGLFERLVVINIPALERPGFGKVDPTPLHALVNPEIVWYSDDQFKAGEGCLSVRGFEGYVVRPARIGVIAYDEKGKRLEFEASSLYARALQHEIDHLNGILYTDRVAELRDLRRVSPVDANDPVWSGNPKFGKAEALSL